MDDSVKVSQDGLENRPVPSRGSLYLDADQKEDEELLEVDTEGVRLRAPLGSKVTYQ